MWTLPRFSKLGEPCQAGILPGGLLPTCQCCETLSNNVFAFGLPMVEMCSGHAHICWPVSSRFELVAATIAPVSFLSNYVNVFCV